MIIMKFGGSSLKNAERIKNVCKIIEDNLKHNPIVVCSALGSTTDNLLTAAKNALESKVSAKDIKNLHLETAKELNCTAEIADLILELENLLQGICLLKQLSDQTKDHLVSFGERLSVRIISAYLNSINVKSKFYDAWDIGFKTNSNFSNAEILKNTDTGINEKLGFLKKDYSHTPIVTGFIAKDANNNITTLGRGGSDLTASIIGASLSCKEIQVWKDVNGIMTTDPRTVPEALPVPFVSFEEASELAFFGAKVLHPLSIVPAMLKGIPVRVKNSYNPAHEGSAIISDDESLKHDKSFVKALTCKRNVTLIDIVSSRMLGQYGFLAKVFEIFNRHQISVDMLASSEVSVSLTLNDAKGIEPALKELNEIARTVKVSSDKAIVSIIGDVKRSHEILQRSCKVFSEEGISIEMLSQGASKVNIGFVILEKHVNSCIKNLHREFFPLKGE